MVKVNKSSGSKNELSLKKWMFQNGGFGFKKGIGARRNYFLLQPILKIDRLLQLMNAKNVLKKPLEIKTKTLQCSPSFLLSPVSLLS